MAEQRSYNNHFRVVIARIPDRKWPERRWRWSVEERLTIHVSWKSVDAGEKVTYRGARDAALFIVERNTYAAVDREEFYLVRRVSYLREDKPEPLEPLLLTSEEASL